MGRYLNNGWRIDQIATDFHVGVQGPNGGFHEVRLDLKRPATGDCSALCGDLADIGPGGKYRDLVDEYYRRAARELLESDDQDRQRAIYVQMQEMASALELPKPRTMIATVFEEGDHVG